MQSCCGAPTDRGYTFCRGYPAICPVNNANELVDTAVWRFPEEALYEHIFRPCIRLHGNLTLRRIAPERPPWLRRFVHARPWDWTQVSLTLLPVVAFGADAPYRLRSEGRSPGVRACSSPVARQQKERKRCAGILFSRNTEALEKAPHYSCRKIRSLHTLKNQFFKFFRFFCKLTGFNMLVVYWTVKCIGIGTLDNFSLAWYNDQKDRLFVSDSCYSCGDTACVFGIIGER